MNIDSPSVYNLYISVSGKLRDLIGFSLLSIWMPSKHFVDFTLKFTDFDLYFDHCPCVNYLLVNDSREPC